MAKNERFVYRGRERTVESVVRKAKQAGGSYDSYLSGDASKYSPKEGECSIRILPPTWSDTDKWGGGWDIGVCVHHSVGPDNGAYLCLDKMKGETCPVCEARRNAVDEDEADQLRPSQRFLCWVIDRDNEKAGPMLWSMPVTLFREINARSVEKKSNTPILVDDPVEGYDVIFNRSGTGIKTKYTAVEVVRDPSPLHEDAQLQQRWLEYVTEHPVPEMLNFFEADYMEKVLFGKAPNQKKKAADEEEDTDTTARSISRRPLAVDEEEVAPSVPRSSRRLPVEDVDEEEDTERSEHRSRSVGRTAIKKEDGLPFDVDEADDDVEQQARTRLESLKARRRG